MFLLQMTGFPGSGKSTLAGKIARQTSSIVIDGDVIKSSMLNAGIKDPLLTETSYIIVFDLVEYYLSQGNNVIIDTSCYLKETLDKGLKLSKKYKAEYRYIECRVDGFEDIERRIKTRKHLSSQLRETRIEEYKNVLEESVKPINIDTLVVNTTSDEHYNIHKVLSYILKDE